MTAHLAYAAAWAVFGLVHSLLARDILKRRLRPWLGRGYRLAYNGVALCSFLAVGWVGRLTLGQFPAFDLGMAAMVLAVVHLSGWGIMVWGLAHTDRGRLLGLTQWRDPDAGDDGPLAIAGPYRWTRHPLYLGGHLLLWGLAVSPLGLSTAIWGSLYLIVGAVLEERSLSRRYGESYARYRARVPFLVPWRGCAWPPPSLPDARPHP